jgi:hypothetical protein
MMDQPTAFRIGQLVNERGTTNVGHIVSAGAHRDEWVIRLAGGECLTCLGENLVPAADGCAGTQRSAP